MAHVKFFKVSKWVQFMHYISEHHTVTEAMVVFAVVLSVVVIGARLIALHIVGLPSFEMTALYSPGHPEAARMAMRELPMPEHILRVSRLVGTAVPISALIEVLGDSAASHQRFSVFGLAPIGMEAIKPLAEMGEGAVPALIAALRDRRAMVRGNAALVLGERREKSAVKPLISLLNEDDSTVRLKAVMALGNIATPDSTSALLQLARSEPDPEIKGAAIQGLRGRNNSPEVYALLMGACNDVNWYVRSEALVAFRR
ncbi:MAG: HEAT repeat domain-containing protein [Candidatus Omnitrophica bacterium]|nr:HEAT repeat domain-containing protein [Candidatus Omnitrophota bacterium]